MIVKCLTTSEVTYKKVKEPSAKSRGKPKVKGWTEKKIAKESEKVPLERCLENQVVVYHSNKKKQCLKKNGMLTTSKHTERSCKAV